MGSRLPFIRRSTASLTEAESGWCSVVARRVFDDRQLFRERTFFQPYAHEGFETPPFVFFGDPGEIPLMGRRDSTALEYRLSMLAGDDDLVVLGYRRNRMFEEYKERTLELGRCQYLMVAESPNGTYVPTHVRCLNDESAYRALMSFVQKAGGATLVPHIATGAIWSLARRLGTDTGRTVHVAGPLPYVTQFANDKICFSRLVAALFGENAGMKEVAVYGMAALVGRVHAIARKCRRLVVKLPSSAGSAGNFPVFSSDVAGMRPKELGDYLRALLSETLDPPQFPMIVQVWESRVLSSPSVQLWIPSKGEGPPIIEGVFEQEISGAKGRFSGARLFEILDDHINDICHEGLMLGHTMQELGFFGRCSFDAVLSGKTTGSTSIHWVECNGRWGGVSVPMSLLNRLFGDEEPSPYIIVHGSGQDLTRRSFCDGLDILSDLLWHPCQQNGIIFMTPSGFETGTGLHFVSLASSVSAAKEQAETVGRRLAAQ